MWCWQQQAERALEKKGVRWGGHRASITYQTSSVPFRGRIGVGVSCKSVSGCPAIVHALQSLARSAAALTSLTERTSRAQRACAARQGSGRARCEAVRRGGSEGVARELYRVLKRGAPSSGPLFPERTSASLLSFPSTSGNRITMDEITATNDVAALSSLTEETLNATLQTRYKSNVIYVRCSSLHSHEGSSCCRPMPARSSLPSTRSSP